MSKKEDLSDIGSAKHIPDDARLDPCTPPLLALPGDNPDALEDRLFELGSFLDMMDNGSPAVVDPNILMAIVGHSAEGSNDTAIIENPICPTTEYPLENAPGEASLLVNAASSLLGLNTNDDTSIDLRHELSRKRSVVQHGSEESQQDTSNKRAKTRVSSTPTDIMSDEFSLFSNRTQGKSLVGNTISHSKLQRTPKKDCNIGPRKGSSKATKSLKQTTQESNRMLCVPLQEYQSMTVW